MKRKTSAILAVIASVFCFAACDDLEPALSLSDSTDGSSIQESVESLSSDTSLPIEEDSSKESNSSVDDKNTYIYNAFTSAEKKMFETYVGEVIPFVANNEYYVETEADDYGYTWVCFYTFGNTQADFNAYRAKYTGYTFIESYKDTDGDTWYCYEKGDVYVEMSYYYNEGDYVIDVYAVNDGQDIGGGDVGGDVGGDDDDVDDELYLFHDFTSEEKALFNRYLGEVIPFLPNDEYYVEGYYEETDYENGLSYIVYDVTDMGFALYKGMYSDYDYIGTKEDYEGDTWYIYEKGDLVVEMVYYYYEGINCLEVYASIKDENGDIGGGDVGGDIGGDDDDANILTNDGKGLPTDADGVYDVDFTDAIYVKKVTDQGYYEDGCPTTGTVKVLVIPVEFSDAMASSKGYSIDKLKTAFNGGTGTTDYYSVKEYYNISSYGQLTLDFVVWDSWFRPAQKSTYYAQQTMDHYGDQVLIGDQMIMNEALAYLENRMDLTQFDSDGNEVIDAVVMINTLEIDSEENFQWAYRYWNLYTDNNGDYYEYDQVSANDYIWASYQFLLEAYDGYGELYYDKNAMNTYTFIHEFAHILGADDYYDTAYVGSPMGGYDMMDSMAGDHNAYTKFNYGWLTTSRLVVAEDRVTLTLEQFTKNGDTIIIANNWDDDLGAYQEYFIVVYYTNDVLNGGGYGYFEDEGIVVYHINASLYKEEYDAEIYYDIYNNNTDPSDSYGSEDNLIEFVTTAQGDYVYGVGDSLSANVKTDAGEKIAYTFTVQSMNGSNATIIFEKNN